MFYVGVQEAQHTVLRSQHINPFSISLHIRDLLPLAFQLSEISPHFLYSFFLFLPETFIFMAQTRTLKTTEGDQTRPGSLMKPS